MMTWSAPRPCESSRCAAAATSAGPAAVAPRRRAIAARHVMGGDDTVADSAARHARAEADDLADHLVAQHERRRGRRVHDLRDVRAAEAAAQEAQQHLAVADRRAGPLLGDELPVSAVNRGSHQLASPAAAARTATA